MLGGGFFCGAFFGWMNGALCRMWMGRYPVGVLCFFRCVRELKSEKEKKLVSP